MPLLRSLNGFAFSFYKYASPDGLSAMTARTCRADARARRAERPTEASVATVTLSASAEGASRRQFNPMRKWKDFIFIKIFWDSVCLAGNGRLPTEILHPASDNFN